MTCSNFDCFGHTGRNKRRCGRCRLRNIKTCADCGVSLPDGNKVICTECRTNKKLLFSYAWRDRNHEKVLLYQRICYAKNKQINKTKGIIS